MSESKIINPRMINPDGMYASEARSEDFFSLRDHFAGLAMQGHIASYYGVCVQCDKENKEALAISFYDMADAMLIERSKQISPKTSNTSNT